MGEENPEKEIRFFNLEIKIDIPLILTITSAYSYLIYFNFETGYINAFGLSSKFISLDLSDLIKFGVTMFIISAWSATVLIATISKSRIFRYFMFSLLILLCLLIDVLMGSGLRFSLVPWICVAFLLLIMVLSDIYYTRYYQSALSKFSKNRMIMAMFSLVLVVSIFVALKSGQYLAVNSKEFLVLESNPSYIIVVKKEDQLIAKEYDAKSKSLKPGYIIIKLADSHPYVIISKPLTINFEIN